MKRRPEVIPDGELGPLAKLPIIDPERPRLSDQVRLTGKRLETRARKFCTLLPESFWGSLARKLAEPTPCQLDEVTRHLFTRQSPCVPKIPCADTMDDYIREFNRLNGLRS